MKHIKFRLQPGQRSPVGSTGILIPDTDWIVWTGDDLSAFPDDRIEHFDMTDAEIRSIAPQALILREAMQIVLSENAIKLILKGIATVIQKKIRALKNGEHISDQTIDELTTETIEEIITQSSA
jgi:predicted RNA-binding Zn ribbon-like protein